MSDDSTIVCCILGLCCTPGSARQMDAMITFVLRHKRCSRKQAEVAAKVFLEKHDYFRTSSSTIDLAIATAKDE